MRLSTFCGLHRDTEHYPRENTDINNNIILINITVFRLIVYLNVNKELERALTHEILTRCKYTAKIPGLTWLSAIKCINISSLPLILLIE
jgi:hypothetical protein